MQGRPPKPSEIRRREGNPGHRPLPEVILISGRPALGELDEPPAHLSKDARDFWSTTVARLIESGIVDRVDIPALEQLATQYARIRQAQRVIASDGHYIRGSVGQLRESPALKIEREATILFLRLAENFGLTPVARARLGLAEMSRRTLAAELAASFEPLLIPIT